MTKTEFISRLLLLGYEENDGFVDGKAIHYQSYDWLGSHGDPLWWITFTSTDGSSTYSVWWYDGNDAAPGCDKKFETCAQAWEWVEAMHR